ncbi:MAG: hypothetical protein QOI55_1006, partial [Actinomycetota bacterium]|nr:hypothetical protein [Actinomycetota bacterium]
VGFALFGPIAWDAALIVGGACMLGGVAGVRVARRLRASLLRAIVVVFGVAVVLIVPSLAWLYLLQQHGTLEERPAP